MKKFKEYRMFILCLLILFVLGGLTIYWMFTHQIALAIGGFLLLSIDVLLLVGRYKMILFEDMMMIYEWKVIAMLPTMIEYKDIQSMQKKSKHHIEVIHQHVSHIYVKDADAFINAYEQLSQ